MANDRQIERIRASAEQIRSVPVEELVENPAKWGIYRFDAARRDLDLVYGLALHLSTLPIEILPDSVAENVASALDQSGETLKRLASFNPTQGNPNDAQRALIQEIRSSAEQLLTITQGWVAFLAYQRGDVQKNVDALTKAVGDARRIFQDAQVEIQTTKNTIDGIVVAAREASASAGVGVFTADFSAQASTLETQASTWLKWTAGLGIVTVLAAVASVFVKVDPAATSAQVIHYMTSKLVVLLVLLTATIWCGRIYKASMHQAATNYHRANSLKTFQAFIKAASDDTTRDAVLLETTRSIFAIAPSGYLETTESSVDTGTKVLEIFKSQGGMAKP